MMMMTVMGNLKEKARRHPKRRMDEPRFTRSRMSVRAFARMFVPPPLVSSSRCTDGSKVRASGDSATVSLIRLSDGPERMGRQWMVRREDICESRRQRTMIKLMAQVFIFVISSLKVFVRLLGRSDVCGRLFGTVLLACMSQP